MHYVLIIYYWLMFPSPVFDIDVPVLAVCGCSELEVQRYAPGEAALVQEEGHPNLHGGPRPWLQQIVLKQLNNNYNLHILK